MIISIDEGTDWYVTDKNNTRILEQKKQTIREIKRPSEFDVSQNCFTFNDNISFLWTIQKYTIASVKILDLRKYSIEMPRIV